jgi:hypothetical protein
MELPSELESTPTPSNEWQAEVNLADAANRDTSEEPMAELILHTANAEPLGETMDRSRLLQRMHEIAEEQRSSKLGEQQRAERRADITQLALISYGVLDNIPDQISRYQALYPVVEQQTQAMSKGKVAVLMDTLETQGENQVINLFTSYAQKMQNKGEAHTMMHAVTFFMVRFTEE